MKFQKTMKDKVLQILKDFEQRDFKRGGFSIAPEMYDAISEHINNLYKNEIMSICNEEYSSDEKVVDIARLFVHKYDPHEASKVRCDLCNYEWLAVRPRGVLVLECPNCKNISSFENI